MLLGANGIAAFSHYPSKRSQKQAFVETRGCIKARLNIQRENQKQVILEFIEVTCTI